MTIRLLCAIACATLAACQPHYDCSAAIAGWHPDFPESVQKACRDNINQQRGRK